MAADPDALAAMGQRSRQMAEERFDVRGVNRTIMEALGLARAPETKE
jgi:hypothetical protein